MNESKPVNTPMVSRQLAKQTLEEIQKNRPELLEIYQPQIFFYSMQKRIKYNLMRVMRDQFDSASSLKFMQGFKWIENMGDQSHSDVKSPKLPSYNIDTFCKHNNYSKYTQLKQAVRDGKKETIELLLEEGCPVNGHPDGGDLRTPLHYSVYLGCPEIVKKLLSRKASVNAKNLNNETPLMIAAKFEKYELTDLLLTAHGLENCHNDENLSHLHIACMTNQVDVVKKLMTHKNEINEAVHKDSIFWPGYTPIHFAVKFRCLETAKFLLKVGADITIKDAQQLTPLHLADMVRNDEMIDLLLLAHTKLHSNPSNSKGLSHFHIACTRNNREVVESFMEKTTSVAPHQVRYQKSYNWRDFSPLDMAIYYECVDVVEILLMHGFGVSYDVKNAYYTDNKKLIDLLLAKNEVKRKQFNTEEMIPELHFFSSTLLHLAIENDSDEAIWFLLRKRANCEIKNANGKTALHLAFDYARKDSVDSILEHLNDKENPTDPEGISHLHIACIENKLDVVQGFFQCEF
ncbi:hypothetical protein QAD02_011444 [Eretmocerus hayati]|uniref:Uncharacterized protein n=1 Tax=Eretmocerus hayati TaxID=131215 RepID=A0ACC2NXS2_9HYME|nr:hypothetical protein QAD02_011444 [Eretmocerus hayati]